MINKVDEGSGISFLLKSFAKIAKKEDLEKIIFSGSKHTCPPFAELAAYASRKTSKSYFIPTTNLSKANKLVKGEVMMENKKPIEKKELEDPSALVLLGGLAMPQTDTSIEEIKEFVNEISPSHLIGMCFMGIFLEKNWTEKLDFDYLLDASLKPVTLYQKSQK